MPTLVLLRHSKAGPHTGDDHARELTARGRADATEVREWLLSKEITPSRVVVSTAVRTRQTWEASSVGTVAPVYDIRLYEATLEALLEVVGETPADVDTLMLVGHNPSIEKLAWYLDDSDAARDRTNSGMRTSGVAVFELESWGVKGATLTDFRA